jgi:hypothetical protein
VFYNTLKIRDSPAQAAETLCRRRSISNVWDSSQASTVSQMTKQKQINAIRVVCCCEAADIVPVALAHRACQIILFQQDNSSTVGQKPLSFPI